MRASLATVCGELIWINCFSQVRRRWLGSNGCLLERLLAALLLLCGSRNDCFSPQVNTVFCCISLFQSAFAIMLENCDDGLKRGKGSKLPACHMAATVGIILLLTWSSCA